MALNWTNFENLDSPKFTIDNFCETLDGGQAFRWDKTAYHTDSIPEYEGVFGNCVARLRLQKNGEVYFSTPENIVQAKQKLQYYLDCDRNYDKIRATLRDTNDPVMLNALDIYPTLRILKQIPEEAIMCFICSSSKRIVQIKQCVKLLAQNLGTEIVDGYFALPTFEKIANSHIDTIKLCKLGFRANYLKKTAEKIVEDKFDANTLTTLSYCDAKKYLTSLSGIGEKVADCILLFGGAKMNAFPVDTWIKQAMAKLYNTPDNNDKIREFAYKKFGQNAGFAQQLIFSAIRKNQLI